MAEELEQAFGVKADLIPGSRGSFEVIVDGETVFSKHQTGQFPQAGEITSLLQR